MKKVYLLLLLLLAAITAPDIICAQDFDEWREQHEREFQEFKDERDAAFLKMLQEMWREVEGIEPESVFDEPKIDILPRAEILPPDDEPGIEIHNGESPAVRVQPDIPRAIPPSPDIPDTGEFTAPAGANTSELSYYEADIPFYYFRENIVRMRGLPGQESLSRYWEEMSRTDYQVFTDRLHTIIDQMNLNDWGVLKLTGMFGDKVYGSQGNNSQLFVWFIMTKLGYDVKAGFSGSEVYLLFPSEQRITNARFFSMNGQRYYIIMLDENGRKPNSITTYDGQYPESSTQLSLDIQQLPLLPENMKTRELGFSWQQEEYTFTIPYNQNIIDYYRQFPTTDIHVYTMAANSEKTMHALFENLGAIIDGRTRKEAVNILLRFVQTAFNYKTDTDQFGRQKFMLPEEIIYYPYSDCDDRAILFAFLIHNLIGAEVVGLKYPGHLATAVLVGDDVDGDALSYNGNRYVVADPTYINSIIGMTMPRYRGVLPVIEPLFFN